jgi:hypothetical protein
MNIVPVPAGNMVPVPTSLVPISYTGNYWAPNAGSVPDSVADPDPDPPDPHVFGPPGSGSGSISQRYGSGSALDPDPSIIKQI